MGISCHHNNQSIYKQLAHTMYYSIGKFCWYFAFPCNAFRWIDSPFWSFMCSLCHSYYMQFRRYRLETQFTNSRRNCGRKTPIQHNRTQRYKPFRNVSRCRRVLMSCLIQKQSERATARLCLRIHHFCWKIYHFELKKKKMPRKCSPRNCSPLQMHHSPRHLHRSPHSRHHFSPHSLSPHRHHVY